MIVLSLTALTHSQVQSHMIVLAQDRLFLNSNYLRYFTSTSR
jgi:hypothetical protein